MRPLLNPALTTIWRDEQTLQLGLDPELALVFRGVDPARAGFLALLDGTRSRAQTISAASAYGLGATEAAELLDLLATGGALVDAGADRRPLANLSAAERDRLAPDLAAWSLGQGGIGGPDASSRTLGRRRRAMITVDGAGRVGATLVGLLAAAGIGTLSVTDIAPGGAGTGSVSEPRGLAAMQAARETSPATRSGLPKGRLPDLHVLCPDGAYVEPATRDRLLVDGTVHLLAHTYERVGVVGPLVLPGRTPCLHCLDLHRVDRDRDWPVVSAQLANPARRLAGVASAAACDVVLASAVAAHAALAVLAYVDDPEGVPELAGALLELRPPAGRLRRRAWGSHPACGCQWPGGAADVTLSGRAGASSPRTSASLPLAAEP